MKPFETWTVLPHKPIEKLEENLWYVQGKLDGPIRRVMVVARLADGRLVVWNAIALDEAEMAELEAWGTPAFLVVPNGYHRMDAKIWKQRYPKMEVLCPAGARKKVQELVAVDRVEDGDVGADASVRFFAPPGVAGRDAALEVRSQGGTTLVVNDLVYNQRSAGGLQGLITGALGFTSAKPQLPRLARWVLVKDKRALRAWFEEQAARGLRRLVVSHGKYIDQPAQALRDAAASVA